MRLNRSIAFLPYSSILILLIHSTSYGQYPNFTYNNIDTNNSGRMALADIDGDNLPDVVVHRWGSERGLNADGTLTWYRYPDWTPTLIAGNRNFFGDIVEAADLDGDGDKDIITATGSDYESDIWWYEHPGPGGDPLTSPWIEHFVGQSAPNSESKDLAIVDIDQDGKLDIVTRQKDDVVIWFMDTLATDSWSMITLEIVYREGMAVGDIDMDGDTDLVLNGYWLQNPLPGNDPRNPFQWQWYDIDTLWYNDPQGLAWYRNGVKAVVTDVNNDQIVDVVFSHSEIIEDGFPIAWYETTNPTGGEAAWARHDIATDMHHQHTLQAGDFNNDGTIDILAGKLTGDAPLSTIIYYNLGGPVPAWNPVTIDTTGCYSGRIIDLGSDGDLDFVSSREWDAGPVYFLENQLDPAPPVYELTDWQYIEVDNSRDRYGDTIGVSTLAYFGLGWGDAEGDGDLDLVSGRYFYRNPGGDMAAAWPRVDLTAGNSLDVIDASLMTDVDGDDRTDAIGFYGTPDGSTVYWLEADDQLGTSWSAYPIDDDAPYDYFHLNPQGYALAELVNSGRPEIVFSNGTKIYYYEIPATNPEAGNWPRTTILDQSMSEDIGIGDVDGDGHLDVAVAHYTGSGAMSLKWGRNPGDGSADWPEYIVGEVSAPGSAQEPDRVKVADLNGDGNPDLVVTEESNSLTASTYWFEAPADPTQVPWTRHLIVTQYTTNNLDVADMDNDGDIDVILQEQSGDEKLVVWENDGSGAFTEHIIDTGKEGHLGARVADLDNDGDLDIFSICWNDYAYLHLWRNDNGTGTGPTNFAPVAFDDSFTVAPGDNHSDSLAATDANPQDTLTYAIVDDPQQGSLSQFMPTTGAYTYSAPGGYQGGDSFTFRVYDGQAYSNTATIAITIEEYNEAPVASFTVTPNSGQGPLTVNFDASASYDPDGSIVDYAWDFGDGSPAGSGVTTSHEYTDPGLYTVTLTVEDNGAQTAPAIGTVNVYANSEGLVGHWSFDENSGTVAHDNSGRGNELTLVDGASWAAGKFGSALNMEGNGGHALRGNSQLNGAYPAKNGEPAEDFTVAAWIKLNVTGNRQPLIQKQGNSLRGFNFTVESSDRLTVELFKGQLSSDETELSDSTSLQADTWYHVAVTYDYITDGTSRARLYRDGIEVAAGDTCVGPVIGNTVDLNFGRYYWTEAFHWKMNGLIDEAHVYERALSGPEIAALAQVPSGPTCDYDGDGDVDAGDLAQFVSCQTAPAIPQTDPQCADMLLDADTDVDLDDYAIFQRQYTGPLD